MALPGYRTHPVPPFNHPEFSVSCVLASSRTYSRSLRYGTNCQADSSTLSRLYPLEIGKLVPIRVHTTLYSLNYSVRNEFLQKSVQRHLSNPPTPFLNVCIMLSGYFLCQRCLTLSLCDMNRQCSRAYRLSGGLRPSAAVTSLRNFSRVP